MKILQKRIYEPADESDEYRVLVDRLWPRGISKEKAKIDLWAKNIAPSNELRKQFHQDGDWKKFKQKYAAEIEKNQENWQDFINFLRPHKTVTFLYASKDKIHNNAEFLKEYLVSHT